MMESYFITIMMESYFITMMMESHLHHLYHDMMIESRSSDSSVKLLHCPVNGSRQAKHIENGLPDVRPPSPLECGDLLTIVTEVIHSSRNCDRSYSLFLQL